MKWSVPATVGAMGVATLLAMATSATAQTWTGAYIAGTIGVGMVSKQPAETVGFDTNLDRAFSDTVRTVAGANAFSPGFCGGRAINAVAASGCTDDKNGVDGGGRIGYDWQAGRFVAGGLVDVSSADIEDSVTAFSTTPAFYAMTRRVNVVTGFRGRAGVSLGRALAYGTGGFAWGRVDQTFATSNVVNTFVSSDPDGDATSVNQKKNVWGYQAGAGLEMPLAGRVSLTGEYMFTSLDNRDAAQIRSQGPAPATNPFILVNSAGTDFRRTEVADASLGARRDQLSILILSKIFQHEAHEAHEEGRRARRNFLGRRADPAAPLVTELEVSQPLVTESSRFPKEFFVLFVFFVPFVLFVFV